MLICAAFVLNCTSLWFICNILFVSEGCDYMFRSEHHLYKSLIYLYKPYNNFNMVSKYIFICLYRLRLYAHVSDSLVQVFGLFVHIPVCTGI